MAAMADKKLTATLATTLNLLGQFSRSLDSVSPEATALPPPTSPSPLPLLATCATTLRAQTTKLSLLIITPPFTPSAISTIITSLNDAILPSLLTATLLLTPGSFTKAYSAQANSLTKATLRDVGCLIQLVETRSREGNPKAEPTSQQKSEVTATTGKVWADCDELKELAEGGIAGLVVMKAEQHLELIKDAVKEIEEWDPEDDDDGDYDDDDDGNNDDNKEKDGFHFNDDKPTQSENESDECEKSGPLQGNKPGQDMREIKTSILRILTRIPQSLHVVIHQRLKKGLPLLLPPFQQQPPPPAAATTASLQPRPVIAILDSVLTKMGQTSTCVDDVAERLYTHDALGALLTAEKARSCVVEIVEAVLVGWDSNLRVKAGAESEGGGAAAAAAAAAAQSTAPAGVGRSETKEDRYIKRALDWIKSIPSPPPMTGIHIDKT